MNVLLLVAVADSPEPNGSKRGDIIDVLEETHECSESELSRYLLLKISTPVNMSFDSARLLKCPYFAGGVLYQEGAALVEKRRFRIDWAKLKTVCSGAGLTVDWNKVENPNITYSPFVAQMADRENNVTVTFDPTKIVTDKYENKLVTAASLSTLIA